MPENKKADLPGSASGPQVAEGSYSPIVSNLNNISIGNSDSVDYFARYLEHSGEWLKCLTVGDTAGAAAANENIKACLFAYMGTALMGPDFFRILPEYKPEP